MGHILRFAFAEGEVYAMFDRYVQGTKPSWKRRLILTVSLALHGAAAVALVIYSFIHVEEITPPALSLTFFSAPPPPPPPPPPAKKHTEVKHIEKKVVTPTTIPQLVQPKQEESKKDEDDGEEGGVEGGVAGGVKGGTVGGVVGGVVGGTGAPAAPPKAKNVPPHMFDSEALYKPDPHLPDIVKIQRKGTGEAIFMGKVCVDQSGHVNQVSVIQGIPGADNEIVGTMRTWKFKPQPVPICTMIRLVYNIN
jgi:periplasmic protein TonB